MYHSVTFGTKNTWDDWHIVPTTRPVINPPSVKEKTIDIPGGNGLIDLTDALTGYPVYNNRTGSMEFLVMNDYREWHVAYSDISNYLHGKRMHVVLEDDPDYYYDGRLSVNQWKSDKNYSFITIDYDLAPFKWQHTPVTTEVINLSETRKTFTYTPAFYGYAPTSFTFTVSTFLKTGVAMQFINSTTGVSKNLTLAEGTTTVAGLTLYGDSVTIRFTLPASSGYVLDSSNKQVLDSNGDPIGDHNSGTIVMSCAKGGL